MRKKGISSEHSGLKTRPKNDKRTRKHDEKQDEKDEI